MFRLGGRCCWHSPLAQMEAVEVGISSSSFSTRKWWSWTEGPALRPDFFLPGTSLLFTQVFSKSLNSHLLLSNQGQQGTCKLQNRVPTPDLFNQNLWLLMLFLTRCFQYIFLCHVFKSFSFFKKKKILKLHLMPLLNIHPYSYVINIYWTTLCHTQSPKIREQMSKLE